MTSLISNDVETQMSCLCSSEMLVSLTRPAPANLNRERRVRYQHPKGAPDADLIFGSK